MSYLVLAREVYRPLDDVWAYHTNLMRAPEWWPNLSDIAAVEGDGTAKEGARYTFNYNMMGRQFRGTMVVIEMVPGERFRFDVGGGPVEAHFRNEYQATAKTRTRITVFVEYEAHGLFGKAVDKLFVERRNSADAEHALDQLKEILEADAMARIDGAVV